MTLGRNSYFLGTDQGGNTEIGNFSSIAGGTYIHGNDNHACVNNPSLVSCFDFGSFGSTFTVSGQCRNGRDRVYIGNDVWIGEHAKILSGVRIADGAVIGAHAVIAKNVPPYAVVVGNPGEIKKYRFSKETIEKLLRIKWWDWDDQTIRQRMDDFRDIELFIKKYDVSYSEEKQEGWNGIL